MNKVEGARKPETHEALKVATLLELRAKANEAGPGKERGSEATLLQQVFKGTTEVAAGLSHGGPDAKAETRAMWEARRAAQNS